MNKDDERTTRAAADKPPATKTPPDDTLPLDEATAEAGADGKTGAPETEGREAAAGDGKKMRNPLRKEVKLAIGVSITVVLLALIITLIIIAVQTAGRISQLYLTVFTQTNTTVRNELFIAQVGGDFVLTSGDRIVSDRYAELKWDDDLNGYLYRTTDGESGVLGADGKERYTRKGDMPDLFWATAYTQTTVTFQSGSGFVTYRLEDGTRIDDLNGLLPGRLNGFVALGDRYVRLSLGGGTLTLVTDKGVTATAQSTGYSASNTAALRTVNGEKYLLVITDGSALREAIVLDGAALTAQGDYFEQTAGTKTETNVFYAVGNAVFDGKLNAVDGATGGAMAARGKLLQIGTSVYEVSDGTLTPVKQNVTFAGKNKTYLLASDALYDAGGDVLLTAKHGTLTLVNDEVVLDGDEARSIDGVKSLSGVGETLYAGGEAVFLLTDGSVRTLNTVLLSAEDAAKHGGMLSEGVRCIVMKNGVILRTKTGYYCTADGTFFAYLSGTAAELIPLGRNAENFALIRSGGIETYRMSKTAVTLLARYAYRGAEFVTDRSRYETGNFMGLIFGTQNESLGTDSHALYGVLGANGKVIVPPQYDGITLYGSFMQVERLAGGSRLAALTDYDGKLLTDWKAVTGIASMKDFVLFAGDNGSSGTLYGAHGKIVLENVYNMEQMTALRYNGKAWVEDENSVYVRLFTDKGFRVVRVQWDAAVLDGGLPQ